MNQSGYDGYSEKEQNEIDWNDLQPGIELKYLQKMYLMMALQYIITIPLTYIQFKYIEDNFTQYQYGIYIISAILFILSYSGTFFKKIPLNCILYIIFVFVLYLLFVNLIIKTNIEQTLMVQILILGQIIAQLILVLQTKQKIKYHQAFIYVFCSGLIIFQLFIIQSSIEFYEMIIIYVIALVYGSLLIYATQTNLRDYASVCSTPDYIKDAISGSVRAQFDILRTFCYGAQLIKALVFDDRKLLIASQDFSEKYELY